MEKRKDMIDILKFIGLLLIILAHVCTNKVIMQLRVFDVPLMVLISGYLANYSYKIKMSNFEYLKKRISRLVFPTWIFLTIFFNGCLLFLLINHKYPFSLRNIIESYLLLDGIGYVWIIRVYLLCAIFIPIFIKVLNKCTNFQKYLIIIVLLTLHEILINLGVYQLNPFFNYILSYSIGYGLIVMLGIDMKNISRKAKIKYSAISLLVFSGLTIYYYKNKCLLGISEFKYPPKLYYISYSLFASYLLFALFEKFEFKNMNVKKIIVFISKSSLWIYLWHILYVYFVKNFIENANWFIQYIIVLFAAILTAYIQNKLIDYLEIKIGKNRIFNLFRG